MVKAAPANSERRRLVSLAARAGAVAMMARAKASATAQGDMAARRCGSNPRKAMRLQAAIPQPAATLRSSSQTRAAVPFSWTFRLCNQRVAKPERTQISPAASRNRGSCRHKTQLKTRNTGAFSQAIPKSAAAVVTDCASAARFLAL